MTSSSGKLPKKILSYKSGRKRKKKEYAETKISATEVGGNMRIAIGSDHAGFQLKKQLKVFLKDLGVIVQDCGVDTEDSADYPDIAVLVAENIAQGDCERGILICGTGIGMAMTANKIPGIRAALCHDLFTAQAAREHNDANILVLGGRVLDSRLASEIVKVWLQAEFAGGRHARRLEKIRLLETRYCCREEK